jgi:virginiamycin B lyase
MKPTPTSDTSNTLEQPTLAEPEAPYQLQTASARQRSMRPKRLRYDAWFALGMLALGAITLYLLSQGGTVFQRPTTNQTGTTANIDVRTPQPAAQPLPPGVNAARTREYVFSQPNIGLMQPSVDAQGNIWFGEMGANRLTRLDPRTNHVSTWQPPNGRYNIMSTAIDVQGNVWFTEQAANYIGKFDPTTQRFTTYPLEVSNGRIAAPQDLQFDQAGMLWFTEINSVKIGRLDPASGAITTWPIPLLPGAKQTFPYSLTISGDGGVWFGEITGGAIGRLDPATGAIHLYPLPTPDAQVFSTAADSQGRIWFTELQDGKLGMVDGKTGTVVEKPVPQTLGRAAGLYDVVTDASGNVWFACASVDALVRYAPQSDGFTFYQLATPNSAPYGLTLDANGALWFTADASPNNYVGTMLP